MGVGAGGAHDGHAPDQVGGTIHAVFVLLGQQRAVGFHHQVHGHLPGVLSDDLGVKFAHGVHGSGAHVRGVQFARGKGLVHGRAGSEFLGHDVDAFFRVVAHLIGVVNGSAVIAGQDAYLNLGNLRLVGFGLFLFAAGHGQAEHETQYQGKYLLHEKPTSKMLLFSIHL